MNATNATAHVSPTRPPCLVQHIVDLDGLGSIHISAICPSEDGVPDVRVIITSLLGDQGGRMGLSWSTDTAHAVARALMDVAHEAEAAVREAHIERTRAFVDAHDSP